MYEIIRGRVPTAKKILLYGVEGIGKTSLAARFPDPLFIDVEGGANSYDVARFPTPTSWSMLLDEIRQVIAHPEMCRTLVIDTVDWAEKLAYSHICSIKGWDSIEAPGYGAGYRYAYEEMGKLLNLLSDVVSKGVNVVGNAHATMRKFEQPDEMGSYDRWELKLQTSAKCNTASMVKEWADIVLFCNYKTYVIKTDDKDKKGKAQGGRRVMYASHHPCWDAKNRYGLPDEMPLDYEAIRHVIEDRAAPTPMQQPAPVNPPDPPAAPSPSPEPPAVPSGAASIPQALLDLMDTWKVDEAEIQTVVAEKGYFPKDMPVADYPADFVHGVLIGAWDQVHTCIVNNRDLPF